MSTTGLADGSYGLTVSATDNDGVEPNHADSGSGGANLIIDGTAPTVPGGLSASVSRKGRVNLSWSASSDAGSGVEFYSVYRDGTYIGQTGSTGFTDSNTTGGATYGYTVSASDTVGNVSGGSQSLSVTIGSGGGGKDGGGSGGGGGGRGGKKN